MDGPARDFDGADSDVGAAAAGTRHEAAGLGRRQLFARAAGVSVAGLLARPDAAAAAPRQRQEQEPGWSHAAGEPRGSDIGRVKGRSAEGRYGYLFKRLPPFAPDDQLLRDLAYAMVDPRALSATTDPSDGDDHDNPEISGGYTFLGQFIDHDITRDTTPLGQQRVDPHGLKNFISPWLDLGSVYGGGPRRNPELYDPGRRGYLAVGSHSSMLDLPRRADGSAYVGDPRNDENLIVCQLHVAFLQFHNSLLDRGLGFEAARRLTQWHYQWLVVNEFLPRVAGPAVVQGLLDPASRRHFKKHYRPKNKKKPMIPLEFTVAAYRFGHSMIRPEYEMNDAHTGPIFPHADDPRDDLRGSRPVPGSLRADWTYFFDVPGKPRPDGHNLSRLIDTRLAIPLHGLPAEVVPRGPGMVVDLAERNLLRGKRLGLAAGQDVARALGEQALSNDELGLTDPDWAGRAPLWFYVLKEAELTQQGRRLGPVGGMLVAGTILGLIAFDRSSYLNARPAWRPAQTPFTVGDFLQQAGMIWR